MDECPVSTEQYNPKVRKHVHTVQDNLKALNHTSEVITKVI